MGTKTPTADSSNTTSTPRIELKTMVSLLPAVGDVCGSVLLLVGVGDVCCLVL